MATFKSEYIKVTKEAGTIRLMKKNSFDVFSEDILGLGKIENKSKPMNALSAIFDLEGFTNFCQQMDPQLAVPEYLSEFLKWIFIEIKNETIETIHDEGYVTYSDLPFLSKYLGDGILFLWDTENMEYEAITNIVISLYEICEKYKREFLPLISKKIIAPPLNLRCGIARGMVYSVGNGNDYVGPCINMSSRLQKLNSLTLCFSRRGIDPDEMADSYREKFVVKKVNIRGIGTEELVCVVKDEFDKLDITEKGKFKPV